MMAAMATGAGRYVLKNRPSHNPTTDNKTASNSSNVEKNSQNNAENKSSNPSKNHNSTSAETDSEAGKPHNHPVKQGSNGTDPVKANNKPSGSAKVVSTEDFKQRVSDARASARSDHKKSGNVAVADIDIDAPSMPKEMKAHSGIQDAERGFVGKVDAGFRASSQPRKDGRITPRDVDSENKILSNLANSLGNNTAAKGKVTIFSELPPCASYQGVAHQFMQRYPNIEVKILHNGSRLAPSKREQ